MEVKEMAQKKVEELVKNMEEMAYGNIHIHAGVDRKVVTNLWKKDDKERTYIDIKCYSNAGNLKGTYKCGYVDMVTGEYVCGAYDHVNAETKTYLR